MPSAFLSGSMADMCPPFSSLQGFCLLLELAVALQLVVGQLCQQMILPSSVSQPMTRAASGSLSQPPIPLGGCLRRTLHTAIELPWNPLL